jgi:lysophospholipase L1-like esterase
MTATLANPSIGFRLGTSGDSVVLDFVQVNDGTFAVSPIDVSAAPVALAADSAYITIPTTTTLSLAASYVASKSSPATALEGLAASTDAIGSANPRMAFLTNSGLLKGFSPGTGYAGSYGPYPWDSVSETRSSTNNISSSSGGWDTITNTPTGADAVAFYIGRWNSGYGTLGGVVRGGCTDAAPWACTRRLVNWVGDSIVGGVGSTPDTPPRQLQAALPGRQVVNGGVPSDTTTLCAARWNSTYKTTPAKVLIWSCGVNDAATDVSGATALANATAVWTDAVSRGMRVIITGIMPWKTSLSWTSGRQTQADIYTAGAQAWAAANSQTFVDTTSMGGGGSDPLILQAAYNSGDAIHPSAAGATALKSLVAGANP